MFSVLLTMTYYDTTPDEDKTGFTDNVIFRIIVLLGP